MGNRQNRKLAGQLLKKWNIPKNFVETYQTYPKTKYSSSDVIARINKVLKYDLGDIVTDCDGFNHMIIGLLSGYEKMYPIIWHPSTSPFPNRIISFVYSDGFTSCGCRQSLLGPPRSKKAIENEFLSDDKRYLSTRLTGIMMKYHKQGISALDENGMLTQEIIKEYWEEFR